MVYTHSHALRNGLLHGQAVRPRRAGGEGSVEVELETGIFSQRIVRDLHNPHLMVTLKMDDSLIVLVQEVVRNHQAGIVVGKDYVVGPGIRSEADNCSGDLLQIGSVGGIEHNHLSGHERTENQAVAALWSG